MWGQQVRASPQLELGVGAETLTPEREGGRDRGGGGDRPRGGGVQAGLGKRPDVAKEGRGQEPERAKKLGRGLSLSPFLRGCLELQACPGWEVGAPVVFRVLVGSSAPHRRATGNS